MTKPLQPIGQLIAQSWEDFLRHWERTLSVSMWLLLAPALLLPVIFLNNAFSDFSDLYATAVSIIGLVVSVWVSIRLSLIVLAQNRGSEPDKDERQKAWAFFWPYLWVNILSGLAILGGSLVFVLPGIWLSVTLMFARYVVLDSNTRGTQALATSHVLVKGRWWATFWRLVLPGLLFFGLLIIVTSFVVAIVGSIAGLGKLQGIMLSLDNGSDLVASSVRDLLQGVADAIFMPLFVWWQVKLYHNLKDTR